MRKLKSKKGFTLVEMLACCVTLVLVGGICTMGTNMALDSYNRSMFVSDSQMLESTLDLYLGDILRHATIESNGEEDLGSGNYGIKSITNKSYGMYLGTLGLQEDSGKENYRRILIYKTAEALAEGKGLMFVNDNVYGKTLYISDFVLKYNVAGHYVTGSYKIKSTILEDAVRECDFTYRIATMY